MSRLSKRSAKKLELLEGLAALLWSIRLASEVLAIRLEQLRRREPRLARLIEAAQDEAIDILDDSERAHKMLKMLLDAEQRERLKKVSTSNV